MKRKLKILTTLGLASVLALSLASCSSNNNGGGSDNQSASQSYQQSDTFSLNDNGEINGFQEGVTLTNGGELEISHPDAGVVHVADVAFGKLTANSQVLIVTPDGVEEVEQEDDPHENPFEHMELDTLNIVIGEGIESIGKNSFSFNGLQGTMSFQSGLKSIGDRAFMGTLLNVGSLPSTLEFIGDASFNGANVSGDLVLPSALQYVGKAAFASTKIESLTFDGIDLKSIGSEAFTSNHELRSVVLPFGLEEIEALAFANNLGLTEVTLPDTLRVIGANAFEWCMLIEELKLPESLERIGDEAFLMCTNITEIRIPGNVKELGKELFTNCSNLKTVVFGEGIQSLNFEKVLYGSTAIKSIEIPSTVTEISDQFFGYGDAATYDTLEVIHCYSEHLTAEDFPSSVRDKVEFVTR